MGSQRAMLAAACSAYEDAEIGGDPAWVGRATIGAQGVGWLREEILEHLDGVGVKLTFWTHRSFYAGAQVFLGARKAGPVQLSQWTALRARLCPVSFSPGG